jgi:hypothetical protein
MTRAILRSFALAALTLAVGGLGKLVYVVWLCPEHRAEQRVRSGQTEVILDRGFRYARADEAIYVCTVPHRIGSFLVHDDLGCYCAPANLGAEALGRTLDGSCHVDRPHAARTDDTGACRHAHCIDPIVPGLITP